MSVPSMVRGAAEAGLRVVVGDAPVRLVRRADRFAFEVLQLLAATQTDVAALGDTGDRLAETLERLDTRVSTLEQTIGRTQADVAEIRAGVEALRGLLPDDSAGPIERVRQAVSG